VPVAGTYGAQDLIGIANLLCVYGLEPAGGFSTLGLTKP
jgi:hypothetical protein